MPTQSAASGQAASINLPAVANAPEATLQLVNRDIVTLRATVGGASPQLRVDRARNRIRSIPESEIDLTLTSNPIVVGEMRGIQFMLGDSPLFSLVEADVDAETGQSFSDLVALTEARLVDARRAWHQTRDGQQLAWSLLRVAVAPLIFLVLIRLVYLGSRQVLVSLDVKRDLLAARYDHIAQPDPPLVVPKAQWFTAPARAHGVEASLPGG